MKEDPETRFLYQLASHLHMTLGQIMDLSTEEIRGWSVFLKQQNEGRSNGHP